MSVELRPHLAALAETLRVGGVVCEVAGGEHAVWLQVGTVPVYCHHVTGREGPVFCTVGCRRLGATHDLSGAAAKVRELARNGWRGAA